MAQYIDKSALVAEIEKRRRDWRYGSSTEAKFKREECDDILSFIYTLETKEVDLEKECKTYLKNNFTSKEAPDEFLTTQMQLDDMVLFAKYFYELGLAQKGEYVMKANTPVNFFSIYSKEEVTEIDKRIEKKQKEYDAKLRDKMMKAKDFPMTD